MWLKSAPWPSPKTLCATFNTIININLLYQFFLISVLINMLTGCNGQNQNIIKYVNQNSNDTNERVGGDCEAGYCDLIYNGMPEKINSVDTSAGWYEKGQKLIVTGTVF